MSEIKSFNPDAEDINVRLERVAESISKTFSEIVREGPLNNLSVNVLRNAERLPVLEKMFEDALADEVLGRYLTEIQLKSESVKEYIIKLRQKTLVKIEKFFLDEIKAKPTIENQNFCRRCLAVVRQRLTV